jgi:hypothetical protein
MDDDAECAFPDRNRRRDQRQSQENLSTRIPAETEDVGEIEECCEAHSGMKIGRKPQSQGDRLRAYGCSIASSMSITGMSLTIG